MNTFELAKFILSLTKGSLSMTGLIAILAFICTVNSTEFPFGFATDEGNDFSLGFGNKNKYYYNYKRYADQKYNRSPMYDYDYPMSKENEE